MEEAGETLEMKMVSDKPIITTVPNKATLIASKTIALTKLAFLLFNKPKIPNAL